MRSTKHNKGQGDIIILKGLQINFLGCEFGKSGVRNGPNYRPF